MRHALLLLAVLLVAGCGDTMSRGLLITGDGKVGANNAVNARAAAQDRLATAIAEDLGQGWIARVAIAEAPVWIEDRLLDDGDWRWERITATVAIVPPPGCSLPEAKRGELEAGSRDYLLGKLKRKDAAALSLALAVEAPAVAAAPVAVPPVPRAPVGARTYVVQPGDTLADLSTAFYGTPQHWRLIADANPGGTAAGQTVVIPALPAAPAPAPAP